MSVEAMGYSSLERKRAPRFRAPARSIDRMVERPIAYFGGFACSAVHSMAEPTDSQPLPLQAFWPLQELLADLQALCPLQALTPLQSLVAWPEPLGLWMV